MDIFDTVEIGIHATFFRKPDGRKQEIFMRNILKEDAEYINQNGIKVSLEEDHTGEGAIIYLDDGLMLDDGETPDEVILIAGNKSCEEVMADGVSRLKKRKS